MANSIPDLVEEVREFGEYSEQEVSDEDLLTSINRAKKHLKLEAALQSEDIDWFGNENQEEALFWTALLFSKLQTGALDAKAVSVGAINEQALLARDDDTVTQWHEKYRNAKKALTFVNRGRRVIRSGRTGLDGSRNYEKREL
jgi:hypothetical protein